MRSKKEATWGVEGKRKSGAGLKEGNCLSGKRNWTNTETGVNMSGHKPNCSSREESLEQGLRKSKTSLSGNRKKRKAATDRVRNTRIIGTQNTSR